MTTIPKSWESRSDEQLLDLRMCDLPRLGVRLEGAGLEASFERLHRELAAKGLRFRPHFWLSDEWFAPDGVPGIAVPFYLGHPRLVELERRQMGAAEGEKTAERMRILRHEAGHAIENAFRLRRLKARRETFGKSTEPYPKSYLPRPYSRAFVRNLDAGYAQSHPDEDFAETFAVWLDPRSAWRAEYAGWPALKKLRYVDSLMKSLAGRRQEVGGRERLLPLSELRHTLRHHYAKRRSHFGIEPDRALDNALHSVFGDAGQRNLTAARFLRRIRREVRQRVSRGTGEYQYTVDRVLRDLIRRSKQLGLKIADSDPDRLTPLLAMQTKKLIENGRHRVAI